MKILIAQESDIISSLTTLFGREAKDFWSDLGNTLLGQVTDAANQLLASKLTRNSFLKLNFK